MMQYPNKFTLDIRYFSQPVGISKFIVINDPGYNLFVYPFYRSRYAFSIKGNEGDRQLIGFPHQKEIQIGYFVNLFKLVDIAGIGRNVVFSEYLVHPFSIFDGYIHIIECKQR